MMELGFEVFFSSQFPKCTYQFVEGQERERERVREAFKEKQLI